MSSKIPLDDQYSTQLSYKLPLIPLYSIEDILAKQTRLGSLPAVVMRVNQSLDDPKSTASKIGRIINEDPALTARLLKLVNSPFYGYRNKVDTVARAIALIGHKELRSLILATSVLKLFQGVPNELVNMKDFWQSSLFCGALSRTLASYRREKEIERYFIMGLLHDMGSLLMYIHHPKESARILERNRKQGTARDEAERDVFGFDHAELGGAMLKKWDLPPQIVTSVAYHLRPLETEEFGESAALVHLAWHMHNLYMENMASSNESGVTDDLDRHVWEQAGLEPSILQSVVKKAGQQFEAARLSLMI